MVAAICHGPQVLAAADLMDGRRIVGFTACRDDVIIMGARYDFAWPAVIDGNIVAGRVPDALSGSRLLQPATPEHAIVPTQKRSTWRQRQDRDQLPRSA